MKKTNFVINEVQKDTAGFNCIIQRSQKFVSAFKIINVYAMKYHLQEPESNTVAVFLIRRKNNSFPVVLPHLQTIQ